VVLPGPALLSASINLERTKIKGMESMLNTKLYIETAAYR
jgi:hypothetical protein